MHHLYPTIIHKDADSDFGVSWPDFPGCFSVGADLDEAYMMALEALQGHIDMLLEIGQPIPKPSSLVEAVKVAEPEGFYCTFMVPARTPGRSKRINVSIDEHLLSDIDEAATRRSMSRSAFLAEGARLLMVATPPAV